MPQKPTDGQGLLDQLMMALLLMEPAEAQAEEYTATPEPTATPTRSLLEKVRYLKELIAQRDAQAFTPSGPSAYMPGVNNVPELTRQPTSDLMGPPEPPAEQRYLSGVYNYPR